MINVLTTSLATTWAIAFEELRTDARLLRTWFFVLVVALTSAGTVALDQFMMYRTISSVSSSAFAQSPLLAPMSVFPDFQALLTFAIVFLAFDLLSRDRRSRIDEVIGTLPVTNTQLVFGRALGIGLLLYLVVVAFIGVYYIVGAILEFGLPDIGFRRPEALGTLATLIVDAFPYLFFWTAFTMLVTVLVRYRALAAAIVIALMLLMYWLQNNAPMGLLDLLGTYILSTQLPSDIAPRFASPDVMVQRVALLLLACIFLLFAAKRYPRLESRSFIRNVNFTGMVLSALCFVAFYFVIDWHIDKRSEQREFLSAVRQHASTQGLDIISMQGSVEVDPGTTIAIDLTLEILASDSSETLLFSLNPDYVIQTIELNENPATFTFENGVLAVSSEAQSEVSDSLILRIVAMGDLNTNFAYLDSSINRHQEDAVSAIGLILLGTESAINHPNYVALMPGIAWYPIPVTQFATSSTQRDFFDVDLMVEAPTDWQVGGPGKAVVKIHSDSRTIRFSPSNPIHQVGLFASRFHRRSTEIEDIEFELLVSPKNTKNIDVFAPVFDDLKAEIKELLQRAKSLGLPFPFESLSVVEVPTYLRTYAGGAHMPTTQSLPGVVLVREGTFFATDFTSPIQVLYDDTQLTDTERRQKHLAYLTRYFDDDISGGNVLANALNNLLLYQTQPIGTNAESLSFLFAHAIQKLFDIKNDFYSAYVLKDIKLIRQSHFYMREIARDPSSERLSDAFYRGFVNRPEVWDEMVGADHGTGFNHQFDTATHHHAQILYGHLMADLILDLYGPDQVAHLLSEVRRRFHGSTFTSADLMEVARELKTPLHEFLVDQIGHLTPAGFVTSNVNSVRLPDEPNGNSVYEFSLFVENSEPNLGVVKIEYAMSSQRTEMGFTFDSIAPIRLQGETAVEIAIQSSEPPEAVRLKPYLSLNRAPFEIPIDRRQMKPEPSRSPKPRVRVADWSSERGETLIVDDLDLGFSVDDIEVEKPFFEIRMLSIGLVNQYPTAQDQGLLSFSTFVPRLPPTEVWTRQEVDTAFGKYRKTLARIENTTSAQAAHFHVSLPSHGKWKLDYYLPGTKGGANLDSALFQRYWIFPQIIQEFKWTTFDIHLSSGNGTEPIEFEGDKLRAGWNDLGTFDLDSNDVTVSVSANDGRGTIVADAIRWTPVP